MNPGKIMTRVLSSQQRELVDLFPWKDLGHSASPDQLTEASRGKIAESWARETCDWLVGQGILEAIRGPSGPELAGSKQYRFNQTSEGFIALTEAYMGALASEYGPDWPRVGGSLLGSPYYKHFLAPDLIREILSARRVEIRYFVDRESGRPLLSPERTGARKAGPQSSFRSLPLCFPVSRPGATPEAMGREVKPFSDDEELDDELLLRYAMLHYPRMEERLLVLPILALAQISPSALLEFLGEWKPHDAGYLSGSGGGVQMVEHVIFRLVFAAIGDLSITRFVPENLDVTLAAVRPEHTTAQRHNPPLLQLTWGRDEIIGYEAGFDSEHLYYAGEDSGDDRIFEMTRNPENCWASIWWDADPPREGDTGAHPLEIRIGYRFEDPELLMKALTHSSAVREADQDKRQFARRTAWIGDAILSSVTTADLFQRVGPAKVGELHNLRSGLTSNEELALVAKDVGLPTHIRIDEGTKTNPTPPDPVELHATHLEALIGAVYLDGGFGAAQRVVRRLIGPGLDRVAPRGREPPVGS